MGPGSLSQTGEPRRLKTSWPGCIGRQPSPERRTLEKTSTVRLGSSGASRSMRTASDSKRAEGWGRNHPGPEQVAAPLAVLVHGQQVAVADREVELPVCVDRLQEVMQVRGRDIGQGARPAFVHSRQEPTESVLAVGRAERLEGRVVAE